MVENLTWRPPTPGDMSPVKNSLPRSICARCKQAIRVSFLDPAFEIMIVRYNKWGCITPHKCGILWKYSSHNTMHAKEVVCWRGECFHIAVAWLLLIVGPNQDNQLNNKIIGINMKCSNGIHASNKRWWTRWMTTTKQKKSDPNDDDGKKGKFWGDWFSSHCVCGTIHIKTGTNHTSL